MVAIFLLFILSPAHDGAVSYFYFYASFCALTMKRSYFLRKGCVFGRIIVLIWPLCRPIMPHSSLMISIIRWEWSVWHFCQQAQLLTLPYDATTLTKHPSGTDQSLKTKKRSACSKAGAAPSVRWVKIFPTDYSRLWKSRTGSPFFAKQIWASALRWAGAGAYPAHWFLSAARISVKGYQMSFRPPDSAKEITLQLQAEKPEAELYRLREVIRQAKEYIATL